MNKSWGNKLLKALTQSFQEERKQRKVLDNWKANKYTNTEWIARVAVQVTSDH